MLSSQNPESIGIGQIPNTDQQRLLHAAVLRLTPTIHPGMAKNERITVKNLRTCTYLNISKAELNILQQFGEGATVGKILSRLIMAEKCPPLRDFYELILKALDRKILVGVSEEAPKRKAPSDFSFVLPLWQALILIAGSVAFIGFAAIQTEPVLPSAWYDYVIGYILLSVGISAGYLLAAGTLKAFDAEVYDPHWNWKSFVPHFSFDMRAARLVEGRCEALAGVVRMVPLFVLAGAVSFLFPSASLVLILGILWQALPVRRYPVNQFISGITNRIPSDTHRDLIFVRNRRTLGGLKLRLLNENKQFLFLISVYWLAWVALVLYLVFLAFPLIFGTAAPDLSPGVFLLLVASSMAALLAIIGLKALVLNAWAAHKLRLDRRAAQKKRKAGLAKYSRTNPPDSDRLYEMLSESLVFGEILPEDRKLISNKLQPHFFGSRETVISDNDEHDRVYLVFKGELEAMRALSSGRLLRLAKLSYGDVFGRVPLWNEPPRDRVIRTLTPAIVYSLSAREFSDTVISKESHIAIRNAVKASFLSRIPFFGEWPREVIRSFARMGSFVSCPHGKYVIRQGQHNQFFYIVYDGVNEVIVDGKRKGRLKIGDFFGETSVLRNTLATADIFAREDSRCLVVSRNDFIQFISQYPDVAIGFEDVCSKRLGEPLFR